MTITDFTAELDRRGYAYTTDGDGVTVTHDDYVDLPNLTALPDGVVFENGGSVDLYNLTTLPDGTAFNNGGYVYLNNLTSLPDGTVFNNGGHVYLNSLTALPDVVVFENGGYVDLNNLTSLPDGTEFNNRGGVYLGRLTALPKDAMFNNRGRVYLGRLTGRHSYRGAVRDFRNIDGYTMLMGPSTFRGKYTVHFARYFTGGEITDMPTCYVAERAGVTAHGRSVKEAIEDLEVKLVVAADKTAIARAVIGAGRVTLAQFRALTGACREGIRQHLAEAGIDLSTIDSMDLTTARKTMAGTSFGDVFEKYLEQEKDQ